MAFQNENGEQSSDLLHSQARIWNHLFSFINSMSLKCAIQLQIPDIINQHGSPMTLSELVKAIPVHKEKSQFVLRLMRILVHSGFFTIQSLSKTYSDNNNNNIDNNNNNSNSNNNINSYNNNNNNNNNDDDDGEKDGYLLTPMSRCLLIQEALSIRPFLLAMLDPALIEPWQHMSTWFMNEGVSDNPFHTVYGMSLWDYAGNKPNINHLFNEAMASDAKLVISIILKNYGEAFHGLSSIVDIGGGTGTLAKDIAKAFPNLKCINFDLPHVINGLQGSNNMSYVGGDMFERVPKADAALLKWILHDWNDEECITILKRCKESIASKKNGGKLIIIDMVVNHEEKDHKSLETQLFWDMQMMVQVKGKERSEKEWAKLFIDAGFNEYKITRVLGLRSLIEVYPK